MANAEVWLNGDKVGGWPYGYTSFRVDLTKHIRFGEENVVAVRLNTERFGSRWYPGAGIYRHVRMLTTHPIHVDQWGVFVTTPEISTKEATAQVNVTLANTTSQNEECHYDVDIYELKPDDKTGKKVASFKNSFLLNGKRVQLYGTCNHHDLGALGTAISSLCVYIL